MSSIHEVAKNAGVSTATVSRVLNGVGAFSAETRSRVMDAAARLNYSPHRAARNLRRSRADRPELKYAVGILQSYSTALQSDPWSGDVLAGVAEALRKRGFGIRLITCSLDGGVPPDVSNHEVDGVISLDGGPVIAKISAVLPTVTLDNYEPEFGAFGVVPDYRTGIREAASRLLSAGHRRIALTCAPLGTVPACGLGFAEQVATGCLHAYEAAGVALPERSHAAAGGWDSASGYEYGRRILSDPQGRPDAVIGSDNLLLGVLRAAWELGVRVPQDLSLVGTDGIALGAFFAPPLTSVDVQIPLLGEIATRIVVEAAASGESRRGVEVTPVRFLERSSARLGPASIDPPVRVESQ